jgi:hypothetical protein
MVTERVNVPLADAERRGESMNSAQFDLTEVVSRLERDVARTVGEAHRGLVHETATRVQQFDIADRQAKIVDDVQQVLHEKLPPRAANR